MQETNIFYYLFLLTNPNIKAMGQKILASPVAPPRSCLVEAVGSIHGNIVGMRQIKRPRTTMAADRSFLVVGIFFKKKKPEIKNNNNDQLVTACRRA